MGSAEAIFYSDAARQSLGRKGAFGSLMDVYDVVPTPDAPAAAEISRATSSTWPARWTRTARCAGMRPAGRWTFLRMGYSLTGARNRPSVSGRQRPRVVTSSARSMCSSTSRDT